MPSSHACLGCLSGELGRELPRSPLDLLERVLLLLQVLLEEGDDVLVAHRPGLRDQALVDRDLVVLRVGGAAQDHLVDQAVLGLLDQRLALFLNALDRRAWLVVDLGAERLERLLQVPDLLLRLGLRRAGAAP